MLSEKDRATLLKLAAASVQYGLNHRTPLPIEIENYSPELRSTKASFVTLQINQQLRGCIGTLAAYRPLVEDVVENAFAAAFRDPRFAPLQIHEYDQLHYHISVLTSPRAMSFTSEEDLLRQIQPGVDGLILEDLGRSGTFLPSVWEQLPGSSDFLRQLKIKAGLSPDHWSPSLRVEQYTVEDIE